MTAENKYFENLKTCFESKDLNRKDFTISAVQLACKISFFEARDTIAYGLEQGILFSKENADDGTPIKGLYFSPEPKGCVVNSKVDITLDISETNWNPLHKFFAEGRKHGVHFVFEGTDPDSFARNIDKSLK